MSKRIPTMLCLCVTLIASLWSSAAGQEIGAENSGRGYIIQVTSESPWEEAPDYEVLLARHVYGICWEGTNDDNLRHARQMGYNRIIYPNGGERMEDHPLARDMFFLLQKPENLLNAKLGVESVVFYGKTYSVEEQKIYSSNYALKDAAAPFPDNLATGWFTFHSSGKPRTFAVVQDWQQQRIVDAAVELTVETARRKERPEKGFLFGGLAWDEGELTGDLSSDKIAMEEGRNSAVTLAYWTGHDGARLYPGMRHDFATHSDGKAAFYKGLKAELRAAFPERNLIYWFEPYKINGELLDQILDRPDRSELLRDLFLTSEGEGAQLTQFADDATLFASGFIARDWVGSTVPNEHGFDKIKEVVGKAGIHGSWFGWFGRFDKLGRPMNNIFQVPRWEQLARVVANWDNLVGVPLEQRNWDGYEYTSANSRMSDSIVYSRQPKTRKIFAVFLDDSGVIPLKPGEKVESIFRVDNLFCELEDGSADLDVSSGRIAMRK